MTNVPTVFRLFFHVTITNVLQYLASHLHDSTLRCTILPIRFRVVYAWPSGFPHYVEELATIK